MPTAAPPPSHPPVSESEMRLAISNLNQDVPPPCRLGALRDLAAYLSPPSKVARAYAATDVIAACPFLPATLSQIYSSPTSPNELGLLLQVAGSLARSRDMMSGMPACPDPILNLLIAAASSPATREAAAEHLRAAELTQAVARAALADASFLSSLSSTFARSEAALAAFCRLLHSPTTGQLVLPGDGAEPACARAFEAAGGPLVEVVSSSGSERLVCRACEALFHLSRYADDHAQPSPLLEAMAACGGLGEALVRACRAFDPKASQILRWVTLYLQQLGRGGRSCDWLVAVPGLLEMLVDRIKFKGVFAALRAVYELPPRVAPPGPAPEPPEGASFFWFFAVPFRDHERLARWLIRGGGFRAALFKVDAGGRTPLENARRNGLREIVPLMERCDEAAQMKWGMRHIVGYDEMAREGAAWQRSFVLFCLERACDRVGAEGEDLFGAQSMSISHKQQLDGAAALRHYKRDGRREMWSVILTFAY